MIITMFKAGKECIQTWKILIALRQKLGDIHGFHEFTYCPSDHVAEVCDITLDKSHQFKSYPLKAMSVGWLPCILPR